jgi:hypothetical protein
MSFLTVWFGGGAGDFRTRTTFGGGEAGGTPIRNVERSLRHSRAAAASGPAVSTISHVLELEK